MIRNLVSAHFRSGLPYFTLLAELIVFYRRVLTGASVIPWDIRTYHLPQALFVSQTLRGGELPLWNPFIYCGHPFAANIQAALFYPPRLIATLMGGVTTGRMLYSLELELIFHVFLAGSFCFILLRQLGLAPAVSLTGASSFQLGAFFASQAEHLGAIEAAAWLPLVWLLIIRSSERFTWRSSLILSGALAMSMLSGFTPLTMVTLFSSALLIVVLIAANRAPIRLSALLAICFGGSLLLSAVVFFPAIQLTLLSVSRFRSDWVSTIGGLPLASLVSLCWPNSFGVLDRGGYHGKYEITFMYLYPGIITLLGVIVLLYIRRMRDASLFLSLIILSCLLMLGESTPFGKLYALLLPAFLRGVIYPQEWILPFSLSLCILGACGIAALKLRNSLSVVIVAVAVCDLTWFGSNRPFNSIDPTKEPGVTETAFAGSPQLMEAVRQSVGKTNPPARIDTVNDSIDWAGSAMITGVPTAGGEDPMALARYIQVRLAVANGNRWGYYFQVDHAASPVLGLLNICCLLTRSPMATDQIIHSPYKNLTEVPGGYLYSSESALPRFYLVHKVRPAATMEQAAALLKDPGWYPKDSSIVEGLDPKWPSKSSEGTNDRVVIRSYRRNSVILETSSSNPSFLVSSEANFPGWQAKLDGRKTHIYYTNVAFRGIEVPSGRHTVEFNFFPLLLILSAGVSAIAWTVYLVLIFRYWKR